MKRFVIAAYLFTAAVLLGIAPSDAPAQIGLPWPGPGAGGQAAANCTGGTITQGGGFVTHKITANTTITCTVAQPVGFALFAGGGSGGGTYTGYAYTGGGGAGGGVFGAGTLQPAGAAVVIGAGGVGANTASLVGGNSTFLGFTAFGGGKGWTGTAADCGYGASQASTGGESYGSGGACTGTAPSPAPTQGNMGGGYGAGVAGAGGGFGGPGQGGQGTNVAGPTGGTGFVNGVGATIPNFSDGQIACGGGNGGYWSNASTQYNAGTAPCGGGNGAAAGAGLNNPGVSATANSASGGGGASTTGAGLARAGGNGGSGAAYVWYPSLPVSACVWHPLFPIITSWPASSGGGQIYQYRTYIDNAAYSPGTQAGVYLRVTLRAPNSTAQTFSQATVGHADPSSGSRFNFRGDQVPLSFNGSTTSMPTPASGAIVTDPAAYAFDPTKPLLVAVQTSGSTIQGSINVNFSWASNNYGQSSNTNDTVLPGNFTPTTNAALAPNSVALVEYCNGSPTPTVATVNPNQVTSCPWVVPAGVSSLTKIQVVAGGAASNTLNDGATRGYGSGAGGYGEKSTAALTVTPGASLGCQIGLGGVGGNQGAATPGTGSWFCSSTTSCANVSDTNVVASANPGAVSGAGGAVTTKGDVKFAGGAGSAPGASFSGGGGGAGGPTGAGQPGTTAGIGGAGDNGNTAQVPASTAGRAGTQFFGIQGSGSGAGGQPANLLVGLSGGTCGGGAGGTSGSYGGNGNLGCIWLTYSGVTVSSYVGPGDVVTTAPILAWWGLRAYNNAQANGGTGGGNGTAIPLVNIRRASDSATCNVLPNYSDGNLGLTAGCSPVGNNGLAVSAFCSATSCFATKLYDQSGAKACTSGTVVCDVSQATTANQPLLVLNCEGPFACLQFSTSVMTLNGPTAPIIGLPWSISAFAKRTSTTVRNTFFSSGTQTQFSFAAAANQVALSNSAAAPITASATDNAAHALFAMLNSAGTNGGIFVDKVKTAGNIAAGNSTGVFSIGPGTSANPLTGTVLEVGVWGQDVSALATALCNNQRGFAYGTSC